MAGYNKLSVLLTEELDQLFEEGRVINRDEWRDKITSCGDDKEKLMAIYKELCALPMAEDFPYCEPSELSEIEKESDVSSLPAEGFVPVDNDYFRGAWLGRCIGCAWGQPVEGWRNPKIVEWYKNAGRYPINYFVPTVSGENRNEGAATDEKLKGMPLDDDTRYTVLYYLLMKQKGYNFDSWDVGQHWAWHLPIRFVCTAETQAYLNFVNVDDFNPWYRGEGALEKLKAEKVNTYLNPYREFIGAQIRADAFAYIAAGMPVKASRLAFQDAYFSHVKNGIYGEMFFAAMIAAAFTEKDVDKCFEIALSVVPKKSRFYEDALLAKKWAQECETREELMEKLLKNAEKYNWVHTINNATFCIAAILRYKDNFRQALAFSVECGYDTDCNGATVGSFMGALLGANSIPKDLADGMMDTFSVGISPYDNYSINKFADEMAQLRIDLNK